MADRRGDRRDENRQRKGNPGGGKGRTEQAGGPEASGGWPVSGPHPQSGDAPIQPEGTFGQGKRAVAGY